MSFLDDLEAMQLEKKSRMEIEILRGMCAKIKATAPLTTQAMKAALDFKLTGPKGHASDGLARRMFKHYLYRSGEFTLAVEDMKAMNSDTTGDFAPGPINLKLDDYNETANRSEWNNAVSAAMTRPVDFSGSIVWVWDNGAISSYKVHYKGQFEALVPNDADTVEWRGVVSFSDRFDLDPRWNWSPANKQGRSAEGERRTRIGYILDLGTDFDMVSPWIAAKQHTMEKTLTLLPGPGSGTGPKPQYTPKSKPWNTER